MITFGSHDCGSFNLSILLLCCKVSVVSQPCSVAVLAPKHAGCCAVHEMRRGGTAHAAVGYRQWTNILSTMAENEITNCYIRIRRVFFGLHEGCVEGRFAVTWDQIFHFTCNLHTNGFDNTNYNQTAALKPGT